MRNFCKIIVYFFLFSLLLSCGQGFFKKVDMVINMLGIKDSGYKIVTNSGSDGGQEVPHFHVHILGGEKIVLKNL